MKKSFAFPIVFMAIITAMFTFILSFLNYSTADKVKFNEQSDLRKKILYVFDIETNTDDAEEIAKIFEDKVEETKIDDEVVYLQKENDQIQAYAIPVRGAGLWGSILGYVAITEDYSKILGVDFIAHSETPGLGGRIDEWEYKEQFRGIELNEKSQGDYIIYNPAPGGNVDAISGATLTSAAVSKIINKDIKEFIEKREVK